MPVAGGPKITKTGILLDVDAADTTSYPGSGTTWTNPITPGTYDGTLNNISFDSTDSKGALIFTGSNTYVDFGNIGDLSSAWSFQVAFKPAPTSSGDAYTVLSYASGSDTGSLTFKLDYSSSTQEVILSTFSTASATAETVHAISASVASGSWSILNGTYGSSILALFKDGNLITSAPTTGSTVGYNSSNRLYLGGTYGLDSGFYTGSVASLVINQADLDIRAVTNNYNAFFSRFGLTKTPGLVTDFDVINFIEATGLSNETQIAAINDLVVGLKANNLWTKMQVIYPFVGGTAFSHKWNLKDPTSNIISWNGSVDHTSNGVRFTSGGYGLLTGLSPLSFDQDNVGLSTYATENPYNGVNSFAYFGSFARPNPSFEVMWVGQIYAQLNMGNIGGLTSTTFANLGFVTIQRPNSTQMNGYYNGNLVQTVPKTSTGRDNDILTIGRNGGFYGTVTLADAYLGEALSDTEAANLYTLVLAYQTALGRNV